MPHIQDCDHVLQGESHECPALAWECSIFESHREFVSYHERKHSVLRP